MSVGELRYRLGTNCGPGPINGPVLKFSIHYKCTNESTIKIVYVCHTLGTHHTLRAVSAVNAHSCAQKSLWKQGLPVAILNSDAAIQGGQFTKKLHFVCFLQLQNTLLVWLFFIFRKNTYCPFEMNALCLNT